MEKVITKGWAHTGHYLSKITNCNVLYIEGKLAQIEIELDNVFLGWVCLPKTALNSWHYDKNYNHGKLYNEYLIDPTLKHLIGNVICCKLDVKNPYEDVGPDNRLFFESFYSLDMGSLLNTITSEVESKNISCFSTPAPIFSMLKNDFYRQLNFGYSGPSDLSINQLEVLRSKNDKSLFLLQRSNRSTVFFRNIEDTKYLTSDNALLVFEIFFKGKTHRDPDTDIKYFLTESGIESSSTYFHRKHSGVRRTSENIEIVMGALLPKTHSDILLLMNNYFEYFEEVVEDEQDLNDDTWVGKIQTWAKDQKISTLGFNVFDELYGLPASKSLLRRQKKLRLHNVEYLPPEIANLKSLKTLNVNKIPSGIANLKSLKALTVETSPSEKCFTEILRVSSLDSLQFKDRDQELSEIPEGISKLTELRKVYIDSELIVEIPIELTDLSQLSELYIRYAPDIKTFPVEIINIPTLKRLGVHIDVVSRLPKEIANKTDLIIEVHSDSLDDVWKVIPAIELFDSSFYHDLVDGNGVTEISQSQKVALSLLKESISTMNTKLIEHFKLGLFERNSHKILKQIEVELNNHNYGVAINLIENILLEVEEDDSWMERLWVWADENNIDKDTIPRIATELTQLSELYLIDTKLNELPKEIGKLTQLKELGLMLNELKKWPDEIGHLTHLTELYLVDTKLNELPKEIGKLTQLKVLSLERNELKKWPEEIGQLTQLTELYLVDTKQNELPKEIGKLTGLNELGFTHNELKKFPEEIGHLTQLTKLYLQHNELNELPEEIGQMTRLTQLSLHFNKLKELPLEIGQLAQLTKLYLRGNKLNALPKEIGDLTELTDLRLHENNLSKLPKEIVRLKKLNTLYIDNLPLSKGQLEWINKLKKDGCEVGGGIEESLLSSCTTKNIQV